MIARAALAVYKGRPALVAETGGKIAITLSGGETLKVREKDIEVIHPGPLQSLSGLEGAAEGGDAAGAWELLEGGGPVPLKELAELAFGDFTPRTAWAAWLLLAEGGYFTGTVNAIVPRSAAEVAAAREKRESKEREGREREAFLARLRDGKLDLPGDGRFLQDVEALAYGKSEKSRTMKELGRGETPQEAHRLLLESGAWDVWINPNPARFGLSGQEAPPIPLPPGLMEGRKDLTGLAAFAIDSPWSNDPDDAVSLEDGPEGRVLYVHVADPAFAVTPGSPADLEARARGATAYLPEQCRRMLSAESLPFFALGLAETSPALTFALTLGADGSVLHTEIIPSVVKVTRLSYEEADVLAGKGGEIGTLLAALSGIAEANFRRRLDAGAVNIELPEIHIEVEPERRAISIEPITPYKSAEMVRECMLLAGEGAAAWAEEHRLPFPYITQEAGDFPAKPLPGIAGSWQLRRCMRPRAVSVRPGRHCGLGLDAYTQVTSPLRRYTDLLAHQQIRAFLASGAAAENAAPPLSADEVLLRIAAADAASQAAALAERASKAHWLAVYLQDKKGSIWDGVVLDKGSKYTGVMIPALALETQVPSREGLAPNDPVALTLSRTRVPEAEAVFTL